jgi:hypothetical protein
VARAANPVFADREKLFYCLGEERSELAFAMNDRLKPVLRPELPFTRDFLDDIELGIANWTQPNGPDATAHVDTLTVIAGRYAKGGSTSAEFVAHAGGLLAPDVVLHDPTGVFDGDTLPKGIRPVFDFLIARGYHHFGFLEPVTGDQDLAQFHSHMRHNFTLDVPPPPATKPPAQQPLMRAS